MTILPLIRPIQLLYSEKGEVVNSPSLASIFTSDVINPPKALFRYELESLGRRRIVLFASLHVWTRFLLAKSNVSSRSQNFTFVFFPANKSDHSGSQMFPCKVKSLPSQSPLQTKMIIAKKYLNSKVRGCFFWRSQIPTWAYYLEWPRTTQMLIVYFHCSSNSCLVCLDGRSRDDDGFLIARAL